MTAANIQPEQTPVLKTILAGTIYALAILLGFVAVWAYLGSVWRLLQRGDDCVVDSGRWRR